ncbi:hypothetical protein FXO38_33292 [Capsicum annuum]|nr:hypothetical protein FXO38_33292 [Capsicum annuum]
MSKYFPNALGGIPRSKLIQHVTMKIFDNSEDALNLAILHFIHTFMLSQHRGSPINLDQFQMVEEGEEVQRLNFSFTEDFKIFDPLPTSAASKSADRMVKRRADEEQSCVVTAAENFDDFSTMPPYEIMIKHDQIKSAPSSTTMPQGSSKLTLDMEDIKTYINYYYEKMIDMEQGCEEELEKLDNPSLENVTIFSFLEIWFCYYKSVYLPYVKHFFDVIKQHEDEAQGLLTEITNDDSVNGGEAMDPQFETTKDDPFSIQSVAKYIQSRVNINTECTLATDIQSDQKNVFGGIIPDSVHDAVYALLFGLSKPFATKALNAGTPNLMSKSQWTLPDNQVPPDFSDAQVREYEAAKTPVKRDQKKSRVFKSPYIIKFGSSSKDEGNSDNEQKQKYAFVGCTIHQEFPNQLLLDYSKWIAVGLLKYHAGKKQIDSHYLKNCPGLGYTHLDFVVAQPQSKNWLYLMSQPKKCWNDEISSQQDYAKSFVVAKNEDSITNTTNEFCIPAELPWHMVDEVYVSINCGKEFHWVLAVIVLKEREDCGVFVAAYVEVLSEGLDVHSCDFDDGSQRARYASLLWHYGVTKAKEAYTSDNDDPPPLRNSLLQSADESAIVTLE